MDPKSKIRFISRCPSNFYNKIALKVIVCAYKDNKWMDIGRIGVGKRAYTYQIQDYAENIEGHKVRLLVVRSSAGKERYQQKLEKLQEELEKDILSVSKKVFACKADAQKEWQRFEKAHKQNIFKYTVHFNEVKKERRPVGNPGKSPKPPKVEVALFLASMNSSSPELNFSSTPYPLLGLYGFS